MSIFFIFPILLVTLQDQKKFPHQVTYKSTLFRARSEYFASYATVSTFYKQCTSERSQLIIQQLKKERPVWDLNYLKEKGPIQQHNIGTISLTTKKKTKYHFVTLITNRLYVFLDLCFLRS